MKKIITSKDYLIMRDALIRSIGYVVGLLVLIACLTPLVAYCMHWIVKEWIFFWNLC